MKIAKSSYCHQLPPLKFCLVCVF